MAGIYLHIPFCRKLCYYCDFHFSVSLKQKDRVIFAIKREIEERKTEFDDDIIDTIYFGGGTPTILSPVEISDLIGLINQHYKVNPLAEITLEANPDDLTEEYLQSLKSETGVNRFSIGTQSFHDADLKLMNRRHTAEEAYQSIVRAKNYGFANLNIDLIYGVPGMSDENWHRNLEIFASLEIPHLSAYHLTFEPRTVFAHFQKKGKLSPVDEDTSLRHFEFLLGFAEARGYEHYEISNFAKSGFYSKHNLSYWTGKPYLGIGPSAHSFSGEKRRWNVSNNTRYCDAIESGGENYFETELINNITAYHDYILTALRTKWGIDPALILSRFGKEIHEKCLTQAAPFCKNGVLSEKDDHLILSDKGKFIADHVVSELMIVNQ